MVALGWLLLIASVLALVASVSFWCRNVAVYRERMCLIDTISKQACADIRQSKTDMWQIRYNALNAVSYEAMLFQFWRPVKSWRKQILLDDDFKPAYRPDGIKV